MTPPAPPDRTPGPAADSVPHAARSRSRSTAPEPPRLRPSQPNPPPGPASAPGPRRPTRANAPPRTVPPRTRSFRNHVGRPSIDAVSTGYEESAGPRPPQPAGPAPGTPDRPRRAGPHGRIRTTADAAVHGEPSRAVGGTGLGECRRISPRDTTVRRRCGRTRSARATRSGQRFTAQDGGIQGDQRRTRVRAEVVDQPGAEGGEYVEGLVGAARRGEQAHEGGVGGLVELVRGDGVLGQLDGGGQIADGFAGRQFQDVQGTAAGGGEGGEFLGDRAGREVGGGVAAPQGAGGGQQIQAGAVVAAWNGLGGLAFPTAGPGPGRPVRGRGRAGIRRGRFRACPRAARSAGARPGCAARSWGREAGPHPRRRR